jgi:multiple sugar transport system ATP-binding protein
VREPQVFLMDEPLSNLDAKLRVQTRSQIATLQAKLGITTVYVTHDQVEAMTMGHRVAVLLDGILQQVDTPRELYDHPANVFVAGFMGEPAMTLVAGRLEADAGRTWVVLGNQRLPFPGTPSGLLRSRIGGPVTVGIRPEHVTDADAVSDPPAVLFSTAYTVEYLGSHQLIGCPLDTVAVTVADVPGAEKQPGRRAMLIARLPGTSRIRPGDRVELAVAMTKLSFFDRVTGEALWNPE